MQRAVTVRIRQLLFDEGTHDGNASTSNASTSKVSNVISPKSLGPSCLRKLVPSIRPEGSRKRTLNTLSASPRDPDGA